MKIKTTVLFIIVMTLLSYCVAEVLPEEDGRQVISESIAFPDELIARLLSGEEVTPEPVAEEGIEWVRDEEGNLFLDNMGMPVPIVPEGMDFPVEYERDEEGNLILDEEGNPIVTATVPYTAYFYDRIQDAIDTNAYIDVYIDSGDNVIEPGVEVTFIAIPYGFDSVEYELRWQYSYDAGDWINIDGANELVYATIATEENMKAYWRIELEVTGIK